MSQVPTPAPVPSVGRIVMYVSHGTPVRSDGSQAFPSVARAAIVTEVDPHDAGRVGLTVFNPTGNHHHSLDSGGAVYADAAAQLSGTWHWPERV